MRNLALPAIAAMALAQPALAGDSVTSVVISVDSTNRVLALADKSFMTVGEDVDLTGFEPGLKVIIDAAVNEEDGYSPATAITPVERSVPCPYGPTSHGPGHSFASSSASGQVASCHWSGAEP